MDAKTQKRPKEKEGQIFILTLNKNLRLRTYLSLKTSRPFIKRIAKQQQGW